MVRDRDAKNRRLAAIVFTDIVGFSAIVNRDEILGARALDLQRRIVRRLVPAFGGREIETAGDSFLLEFSSTFAALRCVVAIQQALRAEPPPVPGDPKVQLRASIHLGDVEHRGREVFGDGVNIAARLLPMAPEGGLAISDQVHSQIRHRLEVGARSLGLRELKNIRYPVEVFVFDAKSIEAIPVEVPGAGQSKSGASSRASMLRFAPVGVLLAVVLAIGVLAIGRWTGFDSNRRGDGTHRRIAVLPFASFSTGKDDDMLAAGLQDSILTNLVRIADLKVTSRTSVMQYKAPSSRKLKEIANDLSVDSIIEGSLQRSGDRLLVQVQLIDVSTDQHIWAQSYDRKVEDIFDVESAISREVARAVKVQLSEPLRNVIDQRPTSSVDAYAAYQRAVDLYSGEYEHIPEVEKQVARALDIDPEFALAHVLQAHLHVLAYYTNTDRTEARLEMAKRSLVRAAELRPDLPEIHREWGFFYFYGRRDLDAATAEYETALRLMPNDAHTLSDIGALYQESDRLTDALVSQRRAVELDPRLFSGYISLISTLELLRDYPEALRTLDVAAKLAAQSPVIPIYRARLILESSGDTETAWTIAAPTGYAPALERFAYYKGDFDEALRQQQRLPDWTDSNSGAAAYPSLAYRALYERLKGNIPNSNRLYAEVAEILEHELRKPDAAQWDQRTTLAIAYAALGRTRDAREMIELVRQKNCCSNPLTRAGTLNDLAFAELLLGNRMESIALIEQELIRPSVASWHVVSLDPVWLPLRSDSAFTAMIAREREKERAPTSSVQALR